MLTLKYQTLHAGHYILNMTASNIMPGLVAYALSGEELLLLDHVTIATINTVAFRLALQYVLARKLDIPYLWIGFVPATTQGEREMAIDVIQLQMTKSVPDDFEQHLKKQGDHSCIICCDTYDAAGKGSKWYENGSGCSRCFPDLICKRCCVPVLDCCLLCIETEELHKLSQWQKVRLDAWNQYYEGDDQPIEGGCSSV